MLTNFFGNTKPVNSVLIIALFVCYACFGWFFGHVQLISVGLFFWFLMFFGVANFVNSRNNLTFDNSFFYLILTALIGFFPETIKINSFFYSNLILAIYVRRVYSLQSSKNTLKKLFDSGFWMGISFLIEPFSIVFFLMTYFSITLHQHIDFRRLFTPLLGLIAPVVLFFTYCFWYDEMTRFEILFNWKFSFDFDRYNSAYYFFTFGFIGFLVLSSLILKSPKALSVKNTFRKNWILVCMHFFLACTLFLLVNDRNGTEILYLVFPTALIIANGFELFQKKWYSDIILLLILIGSFIIYFT